MQLNYDYFTKPECKILLPKVQTNPRYKNFTQLYYTVGDEEQFWVETTLKPFLEKDGDASPQSQQRVASQENVWRNLETFVPWQGYENISAAEVEPTFQYMFNRFKKGIYVSIAGGRLQSFVPFSKANFTNDWADRIQIDPKYGSFLNFLKAQHDLNNKWNGTTYKWNPNKVCPDPRYWYANNCIVRYENPISESHSNVAQIKSMLLELVEKRHISDVKFFINRRDFPLLTRDGTEAYDNIFGDETPVPEQYRHRKWLPILSMCTSERFADIAIPTHEDWSRVKSDEGIYFPPVCRNYTFQFVHTWSDKVAKAVFRGSNTGCGWNETNNVRLKLARLGTVRPDLLDAGITNWNLRVRVSKHSPYLQIPDPGTLTAVDRLSPHQQSQYKFIVHVEGHVSAFRLSLELGMKSCILLVQSLHGWKMWYSDLLKPWVHYVPVRPDLSDLFDRIEWCRANDAQCRAMAENAYQFYRTHLDKESILDHLQHTLNRLARQFTAQEPPTDPLLLQMEWERQALAQLAPQKTSALTGQFPPSPFRNWGSLCGFEKFVTQALDPRMEMGSVAVPGKTIFKSKTTKVTLYQLGGTWFVAKRTINLMKKLEFLHEGFIGKMVLNNLVKWCPNYLYTFHYRDEPFISYTWKDYNSLEGGSRVFNPTVKESTVMQEFIDGPTLQAFLQTCTFKSYFEVLFSLCCALLLGQSLCGFVHHDLKPWNVVVQVLPEPTVVEYTVRPDPNSGEKFLTWKIKTRYIPVMIDYGKSHVVYRNVHYGVADQFATNWSLDLQTLLVSTLNEWMLRYHQSEGKENPSPDYGDLVYTANFLSTRPLKTVRDLAGWTLANKKFQTQAPLDFKIFPSNAPVIEDFLKHMAPLTKKYKISFGKGAATAAGWSFNPRQIVDLAFSLDPDQQANAWVQVPRRIYRNPLPAATNKLVATFIAQQLWNGLVVPKLGFVDWAQSENLNRSVAESIWNEYDKMEKFLTQHYWSKIDKMTPAPLTIEPYPDAFQTLVQLRLKPTRSLFLSSDKLQRLRRNIAPQYDAPAFPDYDQYRGMILDMVKDSGPFKLTPDLAAFYLDNLKPLFDEKIMEAVTNLETIKFYTQPTTKSKF
ncbi:hypothetical protein MIV035R [Invertebrate iridescent virus 3]|uniref:Uncharacterized protein 035R n=1 Tax=Invertebrate iridescent virus 3 TaxID=345201 RepID=VF179_IIV3|nr:hypothetical protein MIV035R [Invertebrate iridescent virus 3]Q197C5.1 RecName: Full=Uncharacterized protein 035R [Invertebrate iridescent virus 3]ABF82065.1 hypothetical protein MIV035R [Invertebrate iridescent virus 3]